MYGTFSMGATEVREHTGITWLVRLICAALLLLLFAAVGNVAHAQWTRLESGTDVSLTDIYFVDRSVGYAIGGTSADSRMTILKTTDGGDHWTTLEEEDRYELLRAVEFVDADNGFIVGNTGEGYPIIRKTTDGGLTWTDQADGISQWTELRAVDFADQQTGYIVGVANALEPEKRFGIVLKTSDGGETWTQLEIDLEKGSLLLDLKVRDSATVFATGVYNDQTLMMEVYEGGNTAVWYTFETMFAGLSIDTPDDSTIYVNALFSLVRSTDNGINWEALPAGEGRFFLHVDFVDLLNGTAAMVGEGDGVKLYRTTDGGASWTLQTVNQNLETGITGLCMIDPDYGFAIGEVGTLLRVGRAVSGVEQKPTPALAARLVPNPARDHFNMILPADNGGGNGRFTVRNLQGEIMLAGAVESGRASAPVRGLPTGFYLVEIVRGAERTTLPLVVK